MSRADRAKGKDRPKPDPFENPPTDLVVAEITSDMPSHILVLNKYPIIQNHFILATKQSKPQTGILEEDDLGIAHACLKAWEGRPDSQVEPGRLFAFFNSGEHSGASQMHRHLQFIPVEAMDTPSQGGWTLLIDQMTEKASASGTTWRNPRLPFVHYATQLEPGISASSLRAKYIILLQTAVNAVHSQAATELISSANWDIEENGHTTISYNLAMTADTMAICPRRHEAAGLPLGGADSSVSINGTILGGTLLVKSPEEWDQLREQPALLDEVLITIGYPTAGRGSPERCCTGIDTGGG